MFFNSIKEVIRLCKEINKLRKEMNRLLSKGMSNIYLKLTSQNFNFLNSKNLSPDQFLGSSK